MACDFYNVLFNIQWNLLWAITLDVTLRWSLAGGGSLREVSLIANWLTEEPIGILVACHLRGSRLRVAVAQASSTVFFTSNNLPHKCEQSLSAESFLQEISPQPEKHINTSRITGGLASSSDNTVILHSCSNCIYLFKDFNSTQWLIEPDVDLTQIKVSVHHVLITQGRLQLSLSITIHP